MMNQRIQSAAALLALLAILVFATPTAAVEMTITGKVSNDMKIKTDDGTVYEIAEDDMGETVIVYDGRMVKVTGDVEVDGDKKVITVDNFKVVQ